MRFVAVKSPEQQGAMMPHRVRLVLMRQRTQLTNAIRSHLAEFGIVSPVGREGVERLLEVISDEEDLVETTATLFFVPRPWTGFASPPGSRDRPFALRMRWRAESTTTGEEFGRRAPLV